MTTTYEGSCLCGQVRYSVQGEFNAFFLCYCSRCQKGTGSAHAANLFAPNASLRWLQGANLVTTYLHPNTRHCKSFCQQCGSALPTDAKSIGCVVVPAGSLDSSVNITPSGRIFMANCADWNHNLNEVPGYTGLPKQ